MFRSLLSFNVLAKLLSTFMALHCILIYFDLAIPLGLIYGPIHLLLHQISVKKKVQKYWLAHFVPFIIASLFYGALLFADKMEYTWAASMAVYFPLHFIMVVISTLAYSVYIWSVKRHRECDGDQVQLVLQLSSIAIAIGLFILLQIFIKMELLGEDVVGFDVVHFIGALMVLCIGVMVSYLVTMKKKRLSPIYPETEPIKDELDEIVDISDRIWEEYAIALKELIEEKKLYLNPNLSLSDLSAEMDLPNHRLSQLLNVHLGTTFYYYIAERRVEEAISRIKTDDNLTIESLAYYCGFNSKSSFNRYFKEIVGVTPSEYRASIHVDDNYVIT